MDLSHGFEPWVCAMGLRHGFAPWVCAMGLRRDEFDQLSMTHLVPAPGQFLTQEAGKDGSGRSVEAALPL